MDFKHHAENRVAMRIAFDKGGWNIEPLWSPGLDLKQSHFRNYLLTAPCAIKGYPGWACDPDLEKLVDEWSAAPPDQQKAIAEKIQTQAIKLVPGVPVGQFYQPIAYRKQLSGILQDAVPGDVEHQQKAN